MLLKPARLELYMIRVLALTTIFTLGCAATNGYIRPITSEQILSYLREVAIAYDSFWATEFIRNINSTNDEVELQRWYDADRAFDVIMTQAQVGLRANDLGMATEYLGKASSLMAMMGLPIPVVEPPWEK